MIWRLYSCCKCVRLPFQNWWTTPSRKVFPWRIKICGDHGVISPYLFNEKDALCKMNNRPVNIIYALIEIYEKAVGVQLTDYFSYISSPILSDFPRS